MDEQEFAQTVAEVESEAARIRAEVRILRKARCEYGAIASVRWQLRQLEDWLWANRFLIWDLREGTEDRDKTNAILMRRNPVPF